MTIIHLLFCSFFFCTYAHARYVWRIMTHLSATWAISIQQLILSQYKIKSDTKIESSLCSLVCTNPCSYIYIFSWVSLVSLVHWWMKGIQDLGNIATLCTHQFYQPASLILVTHAPELSKRLFNCLIRYFDFLLKGGYKVTLLVVNWWEERCNPKGSHMCYSVILLFLWWPCWGSMINI